MHVTPPVAMDRLGEGFSVLTHDFILFWNPLACPTEYTSAVPFPRLLSCQQVHPMDGSTSVLLDPMWWPILGSSGGA